MCKIIQNNSNTFVICIYILLFPDSDCVSCCWLLYVSTGLCWLVCCLFHFWRRHLRDFLKHKVVKQWPIQSSYKNNRLWKLTSTCIYINDLLFCVVAYCLSLFWLPKYHCNDLTQLLLSLLYLRIIEFKASGRMCCIWGIRKSCYLSLTIFGHLYITICPKYCCQQHGILVTMHREIVSL